MEIEYDLKAIGARIRELRVKMKLTQEQMADLLDFGWNHYSHVESGMSKGSLDFYCAVSKLFGVSIDYLLFGSDNENMTSSQKSVQRTMAMMSSYQQSLVADIVLAMLHSFRSRDEEDV